MSRHVDDRELAALRASTLTEKEAARIRRHLASCEACRERAESARVVAFARTQDRAREFASTARRLRLERQSGEEVVRTLLRDTPPEEWPRLAEEPSMRNSGALEQLSAEVRRRLAIDTREALTLSTLATSIAETLPNDAYPAVVLAQMRAHAWKDRAHVLMYLSRNDEALDAVARAEERLAPFATVAHEAAVVQLVKAMIFRQTNHEDEAMELALACRTTFADHGDMKRSVYAGIVVGSILFSQGRFAEAQRAFAPLLEEAAKLRDVESQARIHNNLGYCAVEMAELTSADGHFSEAVELFRRIDQPAEATRTERGAGLLMLAKGNYASAIMRLRSARQHFLDYEMVEEAGLCGLEITEAFLARGDAAEASRTAREVLDEFTKAGLNRRAVAALSYLEEALARSAASPAIVRHVHTYLENLRIDPTVEFVAIA